MTIKTAVWCSLLRDEVSRAMTDIGPMPSIWLPIDEAEKDGRTLLLWFPKSTLPTELGEHVDAGLAIDGWYFTSPKGIDDGWKTTFGSIGKPTHFARIIGPSIFGPHP